MAEYTITYTVEYTEFTYETTALTPSAGDRLLPVSASDLEVAEDVKNLFGDILSAAGRAAGKVAGAIGRGVEMIREDIAEKRAAKAAETIPEDSGDAGEPPPPPEIGEDDESGGWTHFRFDEEGRIIAREKVDEDVVETYETKDANGNPVTKPRQFPGAQREVLEEINGGPLRGDDEEIAAAIVTDTQATPRGERIAPEEITDGMISQEYIDNHLARFDKGGSFLMSREKYEAFYGEGTGKDPDKLAISHADGTNYMLPSDEMDRLFENAGGDMDKVLDGLGIRDADSRDAYKRGYVRVDVAHPKNYELQMASGNERGANDEFIPYGFTSGRLPEAVTHTPIPKKEAVLRFFQ